MMRPLVDACVVVGVWLALSVAFIALLSLVRGVVGGRELRDLRRDLARWQATRDALRPEAGRRQSPWRVQ